MEGTVRDEPVTVEEIIVAEEVNGVIVVAAEEIVVLEREAAEYRIIVNAREKIVTAKELTFNQVVALAFDPVPSGPYIEITVAYRKGPAHKPHGTLTTGETVKVKDGMIFDVTATDKS